jgi:DNA-binding transcriptional regulator PaaX
MGQNLVENLFTALDYLITATEITFSREGLARKLARMESLQTGSREINRSFKRFASQGLIAPVKKSSKSGKELYRLTSKGILRLISRRLKKYGISKNKRNWDGFWRIIIFDIPEDKKISREALRRKFKYFNFYPLQKSVFAFPFKCEEEIKSLAEFFNINDHLEIILAKSLGRREGQIRDFFGL